MNLALSQELFKAGVLTEARVVPAPMNKGFILEFFRKDGTNESLTKTKTKDVKIFKRKDGALADAEAIGFKKVTILFN